MTITRHTTRPAPAQTVHPLPPRDPSHAARRKRMQRASVRRPAKLTSVMYADRAAALYVNLVPDRAKCACGFTVCSKQGPCAPLFGVDKAMSATPAKHACGHVEAGGESSCKLERGHEGNHKSGPWEWCSRPAPVAAAPKAEPAPKALRWAGGEEVRVGDVYEVPEGGRFTVAALLDDERNGWVTECGLSVYSFDYSIGADRRLIRRAALDAPAPERAEVRK